MYKMLLLVCIVFFLTHESLGYQLPISCKIKNKIGIASRSISQLASTLAIPFNYEENEKPLTLGPRVTIKGKILTLWGLGYGLVAFFMAFLVMPYMLVQAVLCDIMGNGNRRKTLDWVIHYWAKIVMRICFTRPILLGAENLPPLNETVIYVPNHTSFMDILVLSGFIPRPFKYLSKAEIKNIPVIGTAMELAKHVFLKRDNLKSTFEVTETTIKRLVDGNSMVLFAEGTRSIDGRLKSFKKGAFQMAKEAKVRIVPVSIGNLHRWMPKDALLPLTLIKDTYIQVHPPIETADKTVSQLRALCHEAVNSGLPDHQKSLTDKHSTDKP